MVYSIKPILRDYESSEGRQLVIQVIYQRKKVFVPTPFRIKTAEWSGSEVIAGKQKTAKNAYLIQKKNEIEGRLVDALKFGVNFNLEEVVKGKHDVPYFHTFIRTIAEDLKHRIGKTEHYLYLNLAETVEQFKKAFLYEVDHVFLLRLEKHLFESGNEHNTVHKKMKNYKKMLKFAAGRKLITRDQYDQYKYPLYKQKIPEFLDLNEMQAFKEASDHLPADLKLIGYYFLLSCFAGYRLSDAKKFDAAQRIRGSQIILKAKKNGEIVSMPVYPMLKEILKHIGQQPLTYSEQYVRKVVYQIAKSAGIERKIVYHTSRHSFAMMLIDNDFSIEEIAELMGITVKTARIYARVTNKRLSEKVTKKLGHIHVKKTHKKGR